MPCNKKIFLPIIIISLLIFTGSAYPSGLYIDLADLINKSNEKIFLSESFLKFQSERETKVVRLEEKKVYYINPSNSTFYDRSFVDLEELSRLRKKYNMEDNDSSFIKRLRIEPISEKEYPAKNLGQKMFHLKYKIYPSAKTKTSLVIKSIPLKNLMKLINNHNIALAMLKNYWSEDELALLFIGYIPVKSSRMYSLRALRETQFQKSVFEVPANFKKKNSEDYYSMMAVELISKGLQKNSKKRLIEQ